MATRNFQNRTLFKGDNLDFLRGMNSGTVDLIATDPPFNKDKDFHATPDSLAAGARFQDRWRWDEDVQPEWVDNIKDDEPRVYELIDFVIGGLGRDSKERKRVGGREDLAAFLCFMGVRLIEMRRVLKDTGSIYLHCDPTASHYLKSLMDTIFGDKNFRNELAWKRTSTKSLGNKKFAADHDVILYYTRSNSFTWNQQYMPYDAEHIAKNYRRSDKHGKYATENLTGGKAGSQEAYLPFKGVSPPPGRGWAPPPRALFPDSAARLLPKDYESLNQLEKCEALDAAGLIYWTSNGKPRVKSYLSEKKGVVASDFVSDIYPISAQAQERVGYPTQKPIALYERIIKASSNPGDIVLDPFCGCATTPIAAERLGRQWVGMDLWDGVYAIVKRRMEENKQLLADDNPQIIYTEDAPERDDGGEDAPAFELRLRKRRIVEPWQRLSHDEMRDILYDAQEGVCGGCGRELEKEFMELDHIMPRADGGSNDITNRIMLCSPCNRKKSHTLTLSGLVRENRKSGWMRDANRARRAVDLARLRADMIKNHE